MSVNFQGNSDTILQSNVLKTIGFATNSLLLYTMASEKAMSLTDFLTWAQSNEELDTMIKTLTNEAITLENCIVQLYYTQKKVYVRKNEEKIKEDIEELEKCLQRNLLFENKCIIEILGEKRRLLRILVEEES